MSLICVSSLQGWQNDDRGGWLFSGHLWGNGATNHAPTFGSPPWLQQHHQQQRHHAYKGAARKTIGLYPWPEFLFSLHWPHCLSSSLQLRAPVYLNSYVSIALLPRHDASIAEGRVCRVSGWGYTSPEGGQIPSTLRTVKLPIVSTEKCNSSESFDGRITENMLCAGYSTGGKDACQVRAPQCFYSVFWILGIWTVVEKSGHDIFQWQKKQWNTTTEVAGCDSTNSTCLSVEFGAGFGRFIGRKM